MVIFDFDGVLIHSVDEVVIIAYQAVTGKFVTTVDELPPLYVKLLRKYRYHIQTAPDLVVLAEWCLKADENSVLSEPEFRELCSMQSDTISERRELLFGARASFAAKAPRDWLKVLPPFEPLWSAVRRKKPAEIYVVTNKDRRSVIEIGAHHGIKFRRQNVFSGDDGVPKSDHLRELLKKFGQPLTFIDDSLKNLREVRSSFTNGEPLAYYLASWGYVGPHDETEAATLGIKSISQADAVELVGGEA